MLQSKNLFRQILDSNFKILDNYVTLSRPRLSLKREQLFDRHKLDLKKRKEVFVLNSSKSITVKVFCIIIIFIIFGCYFTITALENQKNILIQETEKLSREKEDLIQENERIINDNEKIIFDYQEISFENQVFLSRSQSDLLEAEKKTIENTIIESESAKIKEENQQLMSLLDQISNQQNSLMNTILQTVKSGKIQSLKSGYIPFFRFKTDSVDQKLQQETLRQISQGSYCNKQEIIYYNLDNLKSWQDVGSWYITGYTPAAEENGGTHSVTATGQLATPGFTLAIDHDYWEYGTIFYIDGIGFAIAADCGISGKNRGDYLTTSNDLSKLITGNHRVYLVYKP